MIKNKSALEKVTFSRYSKNSIKIFQEFKSTLPSNWRVSHVGSTALGISGKNIVDVLVETNKTNYAKRFFEKRNWSLIIPRKRRKTILFKKKFSAKKVMHVHISKPESKDAKNLKFFVTHLKNNTSAQLKYVKLKKEAVKQGKTNNVDYNKHKHDFIQSILKKQRS
jgi:GrpB-like predicted nucleotidyltransferase (UPF0157 family)